MKSNLIQSLLFQIRHLEPREVASGSESHDSSLCLLFKLAPVGIGWY